MSLQMSDLKALLDNDDIRYFEDPRGSRVLARFGGMQGSYQITIGLHVEGSFLQFRTVDYASCTADSAHVPELLKLLAALNCKIRWVKWAWDVSDGEVSAMGDMWVADGTVTNDQFQRMLGNILQGIDLESKRIAAVIDTGQDPGEVDPAELLAKQGTGGGPITEI